VHCSHSACDSISVITTAVSQYDQYPINSIQCYLEDRRGICILHNLNAFSTFIICLLFCAFCLLCNKFLCSVSVSLLC